MLKTLYACIIIQTACHLSISQTEGHGILAKCSSTVPRAMIRTPPYVVESRLSCGAVRS